MFSALELTPTAHEDTVEKLVHECEVCTEKAAMAGLFASLASAVLLSIVFNCLVYHRMRKISTCKIRDDKVVEVISANTETESNI